MKGPGVMGKARGLRGVTTLPSKMEFLGGGILSPRQSLGNLFLPNYDSKSVGLQSGVSALRASDGRRLLSNDWSPSTVENIQRKRVRGYRGVLFP